jgi:hypothetical protein
VFRLIYIMYVCKSKIKLSRYSNAGAKKERSYGLYSFLASTLDEVSSQRHATPALYLRGKTPGTHWIGGWLGLRAGPDTEVREKILCLYQGSNPGRPVNNQTLY